MSRSEPWLIALDVDGTLATQNGIVSETVVDAVKAVSNAGHAVVLATGRSLIATLPILKRLDLLQGWAVSSNGSLILRLDPGFQSEDPAIPEGVEVTDIVTFDPAPALTIIRRELPGAIFAVENLGKGFFVSDYFPDGELDGEITVVDFDTLCSIPATRVTIRSPGYDNDEFFSLVERIGLHSLNYAIGWLAWLDINPEGISKASALETVRMRLRISEERTVAIGDGRNDIDMLRWAHLGVAMGGSVPEVIEVANETVGSVEDDGVVEILERFTH